jgi:beta-lactamase superfamily II metal-dependent hydrolase
VVARYAEVGSTVINTATAGAVQVRLPARPGTIEVHRHRDRARRFWHAR